MSANVESLFYVGREVPWHGLGKSVESAPTSEDAIRLAGLDWTVNPQKVYTESGIEIPGAMVNVRSSDNKPLGIVGDRYQIVQNTEAFAFTDALLGEGVKYETAGSLKEGKIIWLLAKLPNKFEILGDKVDPYVVFTNTHDGSGAVRVAATNVRIVCQNTLNFALATAKRTWSARHTGSIQGKLDDALVTLNLANKYMEATKETFEDLYKVKLTDKKVIKVLDNIVPFPTEMTKRQEENIGAIRNDILMRYNEAPDLKVLDKTGARLVQAVADSVDHMEPLRMTKNFKENKFKRTLDGNDLLDRTVNILLAA